MNTLLPHEVELIGTWNVEGHEVRRDAVCERIEDLTANVLQHVAFSPLFGAWETLFRDPSDGRLWERTYPQSQVHGGGPPRIVVIGFEEARTKYRLEP